MIAISQVLSYYDFSLLFYADYIVIFSVDKSLDNAIHHLNIALRSIIFTRIQYLNIPPLYLDGTLITPLSSVTYLRLKLDPKLRWVCYFNYLNSYISKWSSLFRVFAGTCLNVHSSFLLLIFK